MALTVKNFEVKLDRDASRIAFGMRIGVVDYIRGLFRAKIAGAEDAGVDKMTAMQKVSLEYAKAARGFRLPRAVSMQLVQWAGYVEFNAITEGYAPAPDNSVGTFDKDAVSGLPGDVVLVRMGGVNFAGVLAGGLPADIVEVRVAMVNGGYTCSVVHGSMPSGSGMPVPVPSEMEDA